MLRKNMKNKINKSMMRTIWLLTILVQLALISSPANALIYWTNKDGSGSFFDWSNGGSDKGLFGSPILVGGDTFTFFPSSFRAQSVNGIASIKTDRLEVGLLAHDGWQITGVKITEYGDYGILPRGKVSVSGTTYVTNLDVSPLQVVSGSLVCTPLSPMSSGSGTWTAETIITGLDWTHLKLVLNNNLMAISYPGSTSFIEKKVVGEAITIELIGIPEPATICLLGLGGLVLKRNKKI